MKILLECCVDSVESAVEARIGGADRLELCADLPLGGTTPSFSLFRQVERETGLPVRVLLRPRFGDFLFSAYEKERMLEDAEGFLSLGAEGLVLGALTQEGELDKAFLESLTGLARGACGLTLHRAFDMCRDPLKAFEEAGAMGFDTVLTSGQKDSAVQGLKLLRKLAAFRSSGAGNPAGDSEEGAERRKPLPRLMPGGGVSAEAIRVMGKALSEEEKQAFSAFHMSGKKTIESGMIYRNEEVHMGLPGFSEYELWITDREKVKKAKDVLLREF